MSRMSAIAFLSYSIVCISGYRPCFAGETQLPEVPEYDAAYVRMEIPQKVLAGQVFPARIVMKNTGSVSWREDKRTHTTLRSQDPDNNFTWGTNYIIQGQGTKVEPGAEFAFSSQLKAPDTPGRYTFRWRVAGKGGFFGEPTAKETIIVEKRPEPAAPPPSLPKPDAKGRRPLTFEDFEYLGSFKLPPRVGQGGGGYSEVGMALRIDKDGSRRLFLNYTHPGGTLFEVAPPALVKLEGGNHAALATAEVKKVWGPLGMQVTETQGIRRIGALGGLLWDQDKNTLYWTWYHGYWTGGALPVLAASKLNDDGSVTNSGPWTVPNQKHYWGGVLKLPKDFADDYTGGSTIGLGFGGYYSICAPCSRGPALAAIAEPDPANKTVALVPLLGYSGGAKAPRDGDYFSANCGFWSDPPQGPSKGSWTFDDHCRAGVFIQLPDKHAYIAFARLGTGRLGYDYGAIGSAGKAQYWYFYNPVDLGAVAKGPKKPADVMPYLMSRDLAERGGTATGSCFDDEQRRLYLVRVWAYPVGREMHPLVHAYRVKKPEEAE